MASEGLGEDMAPRCWFCAPFSVLMGDIVVVDAYMIPRSGYVPATSPPPHFLSPSLVAT